MDLFNNPMVDAARNAMSPEQQEQYRRVGEYMYSDKNWNMVNSNNYKKEATEEELLAYAVETLKAGGDPKDLSEKELQSLCKFYGEKWYEKFDFEESQIKQPAFQTVSKPEDMFSGGAAGGGKMCRQQRRALERKNAKGRK